MNLRCFLNRLAAGSSISRVQVFWKDAGKDQVWEMPEAVWRRPMSRYYTTDRRMKAQVMSFSVSGDLLTIHIKVRKEDKGNGKEA